MGITSYKVETLHRNYNTKRKDFVQKVDDIVETVNHRRFWNKTFCSHSRTCCVFNKAARIVAWIGDAGNAQMENSLMMSKPEFSIWEATILNEISTTERNSSALRLPFSTWFWISLHSSTLLAWNSTLKSELNFQNRMKSFNSEFLEKDFPEAEKSSVGTQLLDLKNSCLLKTRHFKQYQMKQVKNLIQS